MRVPARCNRRICQARRNLSKRPEHYVSWPKCHICGEGRLYVDEYRLRRGPRDRAPQCRDDQCRLLIATHLKRPLMYHAVSTPGCTQYEEYQLNKAVRGITTNTPFIETSNEAPF